ncbi:hypothetical protein ACLB1N_21945 [Escherichia coli]
MSWTFRKLSGYIVFMPVSPVMQKVFHFIASGEEQLLGLLVKKMETPAYTGWYSGWAVMRLLYTYRWNLRGRSGRVTQEKMKWTGLLN